MKPTLINSTEAADILGLSVRRIRTLIAERHLSARKSGTVWLLNKSEVERLKRKRDK